MRGYSGILGSQKDKATIEHLNFDGPFYWADGLKESDLAICCQSCNSSRGIKRLTDWFKSDYCKQRDINERTVAASIRDYIRRNPMK
jgi:hypothetical protein